MKFRFSINIAALTFFLTLLATMPAVQNASASGGYTGGAPRPPAGQKKSLYNYGKEIFQGRAKLQSDTEDKIEQMTELKVIEDMLPEDMKDKAQLQRFAGRLNSQQVKALKEYVNRRFR